jgi:phytoene dehydrogenase-like protein
MTIMAQSAIVVGAGPNGLTAAAYLARQGFSVTVYEQASELGGSARNDHPFGAESVADVGAAAHPFAVGSPAFRALELQDHGLEWKFHRYPMAHPLPAQDSAILYQDLEQTAEQFGIDARAWHHLHRSVAQHPLENLANLTGPLLRQPPHLVPMTKFGLRALWPAAVSARTMLKTEPARALFAGSAAHSMLPLNHLFTSGFGVLFGGLGQSLGWPIARGGTGAIVNALVDLLIVEGVRIHTNSMVSDLRELPEADVVLLDLTPRQILGLRGTRISQRYANHLRRWKYGPGVYKVDYLLDGPIPWRDERTAHAGTVHVGGTFSEVVEAERTVGRGGLPQHPFVMLAQPSAADPSRAPGSEQMVWSYAHVPKGCTASVGPLIDAQIERFAPGFRDRILNRRELSPSALEDWNPNIIEGDIGGGSLRGLQQVFRPAPTLRPYNTGTPGLYICSSSTPPGGGVHGMAGWHAAEAAVRDLNRR